MPASVSLTTCRSIDDMQKHIGVLLLRPLRSVALGVGIGRDVKRVEPHDAIDMSADRFPVLLSRADHRRPHRSVTVARHCRAKHQARQPAVTRASGWYVTCSFERARV